MDRDDRGYADPGTTIVIAKSRRSMLKTVPGGLLLAGASYYSQMHSLPDTPTYLVGEIGVWFFGLGSVVALLSLLVPRPSVRLAPDGLTYRNLPFPIGPVPWHAIRSVSTASRNTIMTGETSKLVSVEVIDKYKYIMKRQPRTPEEAAAFAKLTHRPIILSPSSLGTTADELVQAIKNRVAAFGDSATHTLGSSQGHP